MSPVAPTISAFRLVILSILNVKHDDLWVLLVLDQYAQRMSQSRTTVCNFLIVESIAFNRAEIGAVSISNDYHSAESFFQNTRAISATVSGKVKVAISPEANSKPVKSLRTHGA
jgi:hypothetical protein